MKATLQMLFFVACFLAAELGAEQQVWIGLDEGVWRVFRESASPRALALEGFPQGCDFGAPAVAPGESRIAVESVGVGVGVCSLDGGLCARLSGIPGVASRPTWNPRTGELVFALFQTETGEEESDLWVTDSGLAEPRVLVTQTGIQDDPDISPDGRFLVYTSGQTVQLSQAAARVVRQLWMMDLSNGQPRQLTFGAFQDLHPDWAPDSRRIAFASNRSGRFEIWLINLETRGLRQLTTGDGEKSWPAWSPDGSSLLFTRFSEGRYSLMETDLAGSEPRPFMLSGSDADLQARDADWR